MSCPITVTCDSPPDGAVGTPYTHTFPTTGGPNIFFAITSGALPPGLALDPATGVVSGTPTAGGVYSFTVTITDAQILATGDDGSFSDSKIIIASDDGSTWAKVTTAITDSGYSVIYSTFLGKWVSGVNFAGGTNAVQTSTDGTSGSWTSHSSPANNLQVIALVDGPDKVVALYSFGQLMYTTDGSTWTDVSLPAGFDSGGQADIAYSPDLGIYCISGAIDSGTPGTMTSPDALTWTFNPVGAGFADTFAITWGAGLFVIVGGPQGSGVHLWTSPDGVNVTTQSNPGGSAANWRSIHYANGIFVATTSDTTTDPTHQAMTSVNGISWTLRSTPSAKHWQAVTFGYGFWIAGANNSPFSQPLMTSTDNGVTWSLVSALGFNYGFITGIAFGPLNNCTDSANCSITIAGVTLGNVWRGGMAQRIGNSFG